jgi:uncharacterized protein (UPF0264 family)
MTRLLVSVRSAAEAEAALAGGAALIDVKEPANGSLGRAHDEIIADVVVTVAGQRPVSAALGELIDTRDERFPSSVGQLSYVKWGLAGYRAHEPRRWQIDLEYAADYLAKWSAGCVPIVVGYADWQRSWAPPPADVAEFAVSTPPYGFFLDTCWKDGTTLLDWLTLPEIAALCERCHAVGMSVALAGSLGPAEIETLKPLQPDWFAVRGAVCRGSERTATVEADLVRRLVDLLETR